MRPRSRRQPGSESRPPSPYTYRAQRAETGLNTGRVVQRPNPKKVLRGKHFWLQRFGLIILSLAAIASLGNVLTLSTNARVIAVSEQPSNLLGNQAKYASAADQLLRSSIWNRTKLTINAAQISRQLLSQFPELSSASVTLPLVAHRPIIYIQSAQAAVILINSSGVFVLDSSGKVLLLAATTEFLGLPNTPVVTDQSGLKLQLDRQALPGSDIAFIQTVVAELSAKSIAISALTLPAATSELDVQLTGKPYIAKFNLESNDALQQVGTLLATMNQLQKQNVTPTKYIDVRVDGRAYYQ